MLATADAESTFKTAREEAREMLEGMPIGEFREALRRIGHQTTQKQDEPVEQWKQNAIYRLLRDYDIEEKLRFKVCRVLDIHTDDDRRMKLMHEATIAARDSADASARSAESARYIGRVSFAAALIAVGSLIVSFVAVCRDS